MSWLTIKEYDDRVVLTADINPAEVSDQELSAIGNEITDATNQLPTGQPVILSGNWPLWGIARVTRLLYPKAAWIGVDIGGGTVVVVSRGQEGGELVPLAAVRNGTYVGKGPCHLSFRQTSARGVYRLDIVHPTPGRPIDGHTTVDLHAVKAAIEGLERLSDLRGVLITGHAWRVVIAMLANSSALRGAQWCAVDEPRRDYAVMSWGSHTDGKEIPGSLVPRDDLLTPPPLPQKKRLVERARRWWWGLSETGKIAIITALIGGLLGLCGALYGPTIDLLFDRSDSTSTPVITATAMPSPTLTATATLTPPPPTVTPTTP